MSPQKQLTKPEAAATRTAGRLNPNHQAVAGWTAAQPRKENENG